SGCAFSPAGTARSSSSCATTCLRIRTSYPLIELSPSAERQPAPPPARPDWSTWSPSSLAMRLCSERRGGDVRLVCSALMSLGLLAASPAPGGPPRDSNVAVHVIEKKQFPDRGKQEIALYPAVVQLNDKYTEHLGTAISYTYHLHENFALQL